MVRPLERKTMFKKTLSTTRPIEEIVRDLDTLDAAIRNATSEDEAFGIYSIRCRVADELFAHPAN
jgi:hypothetical protein